MRCLYKCRKFQISKLIKKTAIQNKQLLPPRLQNANLDISEPTSKTTRSIFKTSRVFNFQVACPYLPYIQSRVA